MNFNINEIVDYYDSEPLRYNYYDLLEFGISYTNADFMVSIGIPEIFDDFVFYRTENMKKKIIGGVKFIMVGHHALHGFSDQKPLYLLEGGDGMFTVSSLHNPPIYKLNKNLETFFLFHFMRYELYTEMKKAEIYTSQNYAHELRKLYMQYDADTMEDVEGYWSHLIEDYETGL